MFFRRLLASMFALGALSAATAYACPAGGGDNLPVAIEPELSEAEELLLEARELESAAVSESAKARSAQITARKQRQLAASFRERVRLFPELDVATLLAKAQVADREARAAESRAKTHAGRAKTLRTRAAELRALAKRLAFGEGMRVL